MLSSRSYHERKRNSNNRRRLQTTKTSRSIDGHDQRRDTFTPATAVHTNLKQRIYTNKSTNNNTHVPSFQLFENNRSTRLRNFGNILSSLSKTTPKQKREKTQTKIEKRKKQLCRGRLNQIESMKNIYLQKKNNTVAKTNDNNDLKHVIQCGSSNGGLRKYNKERQVHHYINANVNTNVSADDDVNIKVTTDVNVDYLSKSFDQSANFNSHKNPEMKDKIDNSNTSMRDLIDWLENVDLNGIDQF